MEANTSAAIQAWAGIAQAAGSIIALVVTIVIWRKDANQAEKKAEVLARLYSTHLLRDLDQMLECCNTQDAPRLRQLAWTLQATAAVGESVSLEKLTEPAIELMLQLRGVAARADERVYQRAVANPPQGHGWGQVAGELTPIRDDARSVREKLFTLPRTSRWRWLT